MNRNIPWQRWGPLVAICIASSSTIAIEPKSKAELEAIQARVDAAAQKYQVGKAGVAREITDADAATAIMNAISSVPGKSPADQLEWLTATPLDDASRAKVDEIADRRIAKFKQKHKELCSAANNPEVSDLDVIELSLSFNNEDDLALVNEMKAAVPSAMSARIEEREVAIRSRLQTPTEVDPNYYREIADIVRDGFVQNCDRDVTGGGIIGGVVE